MRSRSTASGPDALPEAKPGVGSVLASVYGSALLDAMRGFGLPDSMLETARGSVAAALSVAP